MPVAPNEKRNSNHRPAGDVAPTGYTPEALNDTVSINSILDPAGNINSFDGKDSITSPENMERYRNEVNGVFTGDLPEGKMVNLGNTPQILQDYGVNPRKITMTQRAARKIAYPEGYFGGKHGLGIPALKRLPEQISDPLAILESNSKDNSLILLTEWQDQNGFPVIVPLHLDKRGELDIEHRVPSAYGKRDFSALLGENGENALYTKRSEDIHQLLSSRLQLPSAREDDVFASVNSIPDPAENINPRNEINSNPADGGNGYQNAIDEYGVQKEPPATPVPNQTAEDNRVSRFAQTEMDSGLLNEAEQDTLRQRIVDGEKSLVYIPFTDVKAQKMADTVLSNQGFISAYNQFKGVVDGKKRVTKGDIALGERLIVEANAMGDTKTRDELLADVAILGREAGQAVSGYFHVIQTKPYWYPHLL